VQWVEQGIAPDQIIASKILSGVTAFTRPLCPYPELPIVDRLPRLFRQLKPDGPTGLPLPHCCAIDRISADATSSTRIETTSQPRRLLSIARLNIAKSRVRTSICNRVRIDQTCFGRNGGFSPDLATGQDEPTNGIGISQPAFEPIPKMDRAEFVLVS